MQFFFDGLTESQTRVYRYLVDYFCENDQIPSHHAIREHFGWASPNTSVEYLKRFEKRGYIERNACNKYRFARKAPVTPRPLPKRIATRHTAAA